MEQILNCKYCWKQCKNLNSLRNHERLCKLNPNHLPSNLCNYNQRCNGSWNKGLTKETDERVAAQAKTITKERPDWQLEVDDDGKLYGKYLNKRNNANKEDLICDLTFQQYCSLVKEAEIKSSDLGFSGNKYVLARYKDQGNYTYGNCRFITQKQNVTEKKISEKQRFASHNNALKLNATHKNLSEDDKLRLKQNIIKGIYNSDYYKKRHLNAEKNLIERENQKDKRYSNEHNSQFNTIWITDGVNNKKIKKYDVIPNG